MLKDNDFNNNENYNAKSNKTRVKKRIGIAAGILVFIFLLSSVSSVLAPQVGFEINNFEASTYVADVDEPIIFSWSVEGCNFSQVWINWGDGSENFITDLSSGSKDHSYSQEGIYNVTIYALNDFGDKIQQCLGVDDSHPNGQQIVIKNEAPQFVPVVPSSAFEDEEVTILVPINNIIESTHDKQQGVLTYIYDFGDGQTANGTFNSITHKWTNAGEYPVSITLIDDQGASKQETRTIAVANKNPIAAFTLGVDIPSTWSFSNDILDKIPFGWIEDASASRDAIKVVEGTDSHKKVLEITGNEPYPKPSIKTYIGDQYFGTIEYFFMTQNASVECGYLTLKSGTSEIISLFTNHSKWYYKVENFIPMIIGNCEDPINQIWYHIRIDYVVDKSYIPENDYFGISYNRQFRIIINGKLSPIYSFFNNYPIDTITIGSYTNRKENKAYIDAIGTTSDPYYSVGNNYNYFCSQYYGTYDWRFDIIGNKPKDWQLESISAEESGNYFGSWSFDGENYDFAADGWSISTGWPNGVGRSNIGGHNSVACIWDDTMYYYTNLFRSDLNQKNGSWEFWYRVTIGLHYYFNFIDTSNNGIKLLIDEADLYYFNNGKWNFGFDSGRNVWNRIRVDFECGTSNYMGLAEDTYTIYMNDKLAVSNVAMTNPVSSLKKMEFHTEKLCKCYNLYLDAIGVTGINGYQLGDNKYSPCDIRIVDEGDNFKEVVRLTDKSIINHVSMKKFIETPQNKGTIQFYVKSSNINDRSWILTLTNGTQSELSITMENGLWKYSLGNGFYQFSGLNNPINGTWYPVSLNFDLIGNNAFTLSVNDITSAPVAINSIDFFSEIKIESTENSIGNAWIDALSFSWDPAYNIDDYKLSLISYPEKSNVYFSAADTIDSTNDIPNLKYYWKFGDGTSGYGRNIEHSYQQSGLYNCSLAVKDDNGAIDIFSQLILIHNKFPEIKIDADTDFIILNEGETLLLNTISSDEDTDWAKLMYFYDFNGTDFSLELNNYYTSGWRTSHLFKDDFSGNVGAMVKDPEGDYSTDFINVLVNNVDPIISIYDASIEANITFEVYRNDLNDNANFTFDFKSSCAEENSKSNFQPIFEVNSIDLYNTIDYGCSTHVTFQNEYVSPVVIAYIMSRNDGDSVDVRVANVTSTSCEIFMEEPNNSEHGIETIGYIIMEEGSWILEDGLKVEAGKLSTSSNHIGSGAVGGESIFFHQQFSDSPVVLHTLNTYENRAFKSSVARSITASSFKIQQESAQTGTSTSTETIGWIAVEAEKSGMLKGIKYETGSSKDGKNDGVDNTPHIISYAQSFNSLPIIVVKQNSLNGGDGAWARSQGTHSITTHKVFAEEDQIGDSERSHADEIFGFWAFQSSFSYLSNAIQSDDRSRIISRINFEGSNENTLISDKKPISMDLCKNWRVSVNSTILPLNSYFRYLVKIVFIDSQELIIISDDIYGNGSNFGEWAVDINPYFYDGLDYTFKYPITIGAHIFDPSLDDIYLNLTYSISTLIEIQSDIDLSLSSSFSITKNLGNVEYKINIFKNIDKYYANITAIQKNFNLKTFIKNSFPVNLNYKFYLYPIINLNEILDSRVNLSRFSIMKCLKAENKIKAEVLDDDFGSDTLEIDFNTINDIEFFNLSPKIEAENPTNASTYLEVKFYTKIQDYDQISNLGKYYITNFKNEINPNNITLYNGIIVENGDLRYSDENYASIMSDNSFVTDSNHFTFIKGQVSLWGDHRFIENNYTSIYASQRIVNYGHYPATYSFEADQNGADPSGWYDHSYSPSGQSCSIQIDSNYAGHNKLARLYDSAAYGQAIMTNYFSAQTTGTIEFWYYKVQGSTGLYLTLADNNNYQPITISIDDNDNKDFNYYDGSWHLIASDLHQDNKWTHCKIEYNCLTDKFNFYINGIQYLNNGNFRYDVNSLNRLRFETTYETSGHWYVDAIGYSWDPNYSIGKNIFEETIPAKLEFTTEIQLNSVPNFGTIVYSYKTNNSTPIKFEIWNYDSLQYNLIDNSNYNSFSTHIFDLNSSYYNFNNIIRLLFNGSNFSNDFCFYLEQLKINEGQNKIGFITQIHLDQINENKKINFSKLNYFLKSNLLLNLNLSLFNFIEKNWFVLNSLNTDDNWYEKSNIILNSEFYNKTNDLLLKIEGINLKTGVILYIDKLRLEYLSYIVSEMGTFENNITAHTLLIKEGTKESEGDLTEKDNNYSSFTSIHLENVNHYPGSWSFENDIDNQIPNQWINTGNSGETALVYNKGHYQATWSFTNDINGRVPTGWTSLYGNSTYVGCVVVEEDNNFKKILEVKDYASSKSPDCWVTFTGQSNGILEFYWKPVNRMVFVSLCIDDISNPGISILIKDGCFAYYTDGAYHNVMSINSGSWYHHKIIFDCQQGSKGKFDWYINSILRVQDVNFRNTATNKKVAALRIISADGEGFSHYFDAFGITGLSDNYQAGDNLNFIDYDQGIKGHAKVLKFYDNDGSGQCGIYTTFQDITSGILEWWWYMDSGYNLYLQLQDGTSYGPSIYFNAQNNNKFNYYDGSYHDFGIDKYALDTWLHFKIEFECGNSRFRDLSADKFNIYINGQLVVLGASFYNNLSKVNRLHIFTGIGSTCVAYIDAVGIANVNGYDEDENTKIELNDLKIVQEFHLDGTEPTDFINSCVLLFSLKTQYSQVVQIYLYNYTFNKYLNVFNCSFTEFSNEIYKINDENFYSNYNDLKIKIVAQNSSQFKFYLDKFKLNYSWTQNRHPLTDIENPLGYYKFKSNCTDIIHTIKNNIVTINSYNTYLGSYSFENDANGQVPLDWGETSKGDCFARIYDYYNGHSKVVQLYDPTTSYGAGLYNLIDVPDSGIIEFWWSMDNKFGLAGCTLANCKYGEIVFFRGDQYANGLPYFYWHNGDQVIKVNVIPSGKDWFHNRIEFDFPSNNFKWYINHNLASNWQSFKLYTTNSYDSQFWLFTFSYSGGFNSFIDAVGYSWDQEYTLGSNWEQSSVVNKIYDIDLEKMDTSRIELLKNCQIDYSFKTSVNQDMSVRLYNFTASKWIKIDSVKTDNSVYYNGKFQFNNTDFISKDFKVKIQFLGINKTSIINNFQLYIQNLITTYNWTDVQADYGYNNEREPCNYYNEKSSKYSSWYYSNNSFDYQGEFLITTIADDGISISKTGSLIKIIQPKPWAKILAFPNETIEDMILDFEAEISSIGIFGNETRIMWDWGDGYFSYERNPSHAWANSGTYDISLFIQDCFGNTYSDIANIVIKEKPPEIKGPFTFYGAEGKAIMLDVEVSDSNVDEMGLTYRWYNEENELIFDYNKPSIALDDGEYIFRFEVEDNEGNIATANISIIVENAPPIVLVSNYGYYGTPGGGAHGEPGVGQLNLRAYAYDCHYDINDMKFNWSISSGNESYSVYTGSAHYSSISYKCKETKVYSGIVKVTDPSGATAVASFTINSFIDSNSNGLSDEFEAQLALYNKTLELYEDSDLDGLINEFEWGITQTNYLNPDTDGDGLYDGIDKAIGLGELSLGTDPRTNDTDGDALLDSFEFYGWEISTEAYGNISVSSNPCKFDTDFDGLNDYQEYITQTDPRNPDTDKDGLLDGCDPCPTKWDGDGDGLNDKIEVELGTDPNNTDTDQDGLTDGQEVLGWGFYTNPLDTDSDDDFLADNAETKSYKFELAKKAKLDKPVSLWFKEHCVKPLSAQLAFTIAFGEYAKNDSLNVEYGVKTVPSLKIEIVKAENNLVLFNTTTNGTEARYISQVVDLKQFIEQYNGMEVDIDAQSFDYFGEYILRINDTSAGCLLEQYEIEASKYLDPNDPDYDNDGILDGVETGALVRGSSTIDFKNMYYSEERAYNKPQAWWTLDNPSKGYGVIEDFSGNGLNSIFTNIEYEDWVAGKVGPYALSFDGTNEYVDFGAILEDSFEGAFGEGSKEFTVAAWINPSDLSILAQSSHGVKNCFVAKASPITNDNFEVGINADGTVCVYIDTEFLGATATLGTAGDVLEGAWSFVVVRYYYGNLSVLINDKSYESSAWQSAWSDLDGAEGAKFTLGGTLDGTGAFFEGVIDDVRVYNKALNDENIAWIYHNDTGRTLDPIASGSPLTIGNSTDDFWNEFQIEIPRVGKVYDADLYIKIDSEETPWGNTTVIGTVSVQLIKDELNYSLQDVTLIIESLDVFDGWDFSQAYSLDLSKYVTNDTISELYGKYTLKVKITDSNFYESYNFTVSEFYIETDTWRTPLGLEDSNGWITDPAKADTDGDGWSDYYEIFGRKTNPCSVDTDGDGAWDPNDRDPLRDLIVQIRFDNGKFTHDMDTKHAPKLQGVVEFEVCNQEFYFTTEAETATSNDNDYDVPQRAWFGQKYYFNVEDDVKAQGTWINLEFELWWMWPIDEDGNHLGDKKLLSDDCYYDIGTAGTQKIKEFENSAGHKLAVQMDTIAIEKCNTIAIFEANSSFNGHYLEQERTNVIQLYATDGMGPFKAGPNAIVIPTSLFTKTKLNSYLQKEQLSQTPLYAEGDNYQFISADRDENANADGSTNKVDFVIIRKDISGADAVAVLDLLLMCLENESLDENNQTVYQEAKLYAFVSTLLNGTKATSMNLAPEVLKYVSWYNLHANSPQGRHPTSKSNVATPTEILSNFWKDICEGKIIDAFVNAYNSFMLYFNLNPSIGQIMAALMAVANFLIMIVLTILGPLLWLLLRAMILIFIYIMLGLILLTLTAIIGALALIFLPISLLCQGFVNYAVNNVETSLFNKFISMGYEILSKYNKFLDFDVPYVYFFVSIDTIKLFDLTINTFPPDFDFTLGPTNPVEFLSSADSGFSDLFSMNNDYESNLKTNSSKENKNNKSEFNNGSVPKLSSGNSEINISINYPYSDFIIEYMGSYSLFKFEYKHNDYEKINDDENTVDFKYTLNRINDGEGEIKKTALGLWDDTKNTYICQDIVELKDGVYNLEVEVLGTTAYRRFTVVNLQKIIEGFYIGLSLSTIINTVLLANAASQNNRYVEFAVLASMLGIGFVSAATSFYTDNKKGDAFTNFVQDYNDFKYSLLIGFAISWFINAISVFSATKSGSKNSKQSSLPDSKYTQKCQDNWLKKNVINTDTILPKWIPTSWGVAQHGACVIPHGYLIMALIDLLSQYPNSIIHPLDENTRNYIKGGIDSLNVAGSTFGFTVLAWYKTIQATEQVAKIKKDDWKTVARDLMISQILGGGILFLAVILFLTSDYLSE